MSELQLRIMIIDDNPAIHRDFKKVLGISHDIKRLDTLEEQLFSDGDLNLHREKNNNILPEFIIDTASQGKEGVDKIKKSLERGEHYALAFVDVRMPPGWDGIETIKHMWELDPDIQVVICTAYSDYTWEDTVKKLGLSDKYLILKKPFDSVAVRQLASALTHKWLLAQDVRDHTERLNRMVEEKTESLQQSLSLLQSTIESSTEGIVVFDLEGQILDFNSNFIKIWKIPQSLIDANSIKLLFEYISEQILNGDELQHQLSSTLIANKKIHNTVLDLHNEKIFEASVQPHKMNEQLSGYVWSFRDITERANLEKKLEYQALHDTLTGLPNRVLLSDRLDSALEIARKHDHLVGILFFDLDRFKLVNDSLTHAVGDELLVLIAQRLAVIMREGDTFARLGGDEFVMLVPELKDEESVLPILDRLQRAFDEPYVLAEREISMSASIGISMYPRDGKTRNILLKNADLAMYLAKEKGGNQFQFYTSRLNSQAQKKFKVESELRKGLIKKEFILYYQPQFDIKNNEMMSVEALLRWNHPKKGLLLPIDFIRIAEDSGLIIPLGDWVIREVCRQIKAWKNQGYSFLRVAVNVSKQQLRQSNFAHSIKLILEEYQLEPSLLEMEIIENVIITHPDIINTVNKIQAMGINIVLDDFGTGNSSLNYLKKIHIDRLKIDKSFIHNISESRSDEVIIEAIIAMAKSFNFRVLAEGVETEKQMNYLNQQNCDEVQGYLLSKPLTSEELETFFKLKK